MLYGLEVPSMRVPFRAAAAVFTLLLAAVCSAPARAQSAPAFVPLPPAMGALYKPDSGPAPHVAVLVIHRTANYMVHPACTELSQRGFLVLCMNTRYFNNETFVDWDNIALDVKAGVTFLRKQPGITKVVLFGHSGGGPVTSYYQAVAENGIAYCNAPKKLVPCRGDLAGLPAADGIVFVDAHAGQPVIVTRVLNPAYPTDANPPDAMRVGDVDAFDPKNGYNPNGQSHYSSDFIKRFLAAQADRMNRLTQDAVSRYNAVKSGTEGYKDDDIVLIPGGGNPGPGPGGSVNINSLDRNVPALNTTAQPEKLLRNDGTIVRKVIGSVVVPDKGLQQTNAAFDTGTKVFTLKSFLTTNAILGGGDGILGFDYCSVNNSTWCAVENIHVPVMFASMGAFVLIRDGEFAYQRSASKDKDYVVIEGALHGLSPCTECETTPGQYSNVRRNLFDYIAKWMNARY